MNIPSAAVSNNLHKRLAEIWVTFKRRRIALGSPFYLDFLTRVSRLSRVDQGTLSPSLLE